MPHIAKQPARLLLACIVLAGCVGCDQGTKYLATQTLRGAAAQSYFADTVRLQYVQNPGGFLSLGSNFPPGVRFSFFIGVNASFLAVVAYLLLTRWRMRSAQFIVLLFLLAGGIGNLIDRVTNDGLVTDFVSVGIGPLRTGIFNVADVAVLFSAVALVFIYRKKDAAPTEQPL